MIKKNSLKYKLLTLILIIVLLMATMNFYTILNRRNIDQKYSNMINKMIKIDQIRKDITNSNFYFDKYFSSKTKSDYEEYLKLYNQAIQEVILLEKYLNKDSLYILRDLKNILYSYNEYATKAIEKFSDTKKDDNFYPDFLKAKKIAGYCSEYAYKLHNNYLNYNRDIYISLNGKNKLYNFIITSLIFTIACMCIIVAFIFSKKITDPIEKLVIDAKRISKGNFEMENIKKSNIYEIDVLKDGFSSMAKELNKLIITIKENIMLEKKLKNQEMINLKIENMLKETKLKVLQSQINPHFLFNTLNCIVQTAILEGADNTEKLINSVAKLLRYSLNMMENEVCLKDEINVIKQYVYIQESRFRDRVKFNINVDKDLYDVKIPGMCLQPLVENAFIHGIEPKEEGGTIDIDVYKEGIFCIIKIKDDGQGISKETINKILKDNDNEKHIGHTTGIGIKNVINRLKIFYNNENIFFIESEENKGTIIYIKIKKGMK